MGWFSSFTGGLANIVSAAAPAAGAFAAASNPTAAGTVGLASMLGRSQQTGITIKDPDEDMSDAEIDLALRSAGVIDDDTISIGNLTAVSTGNTAIASNRARAIAAAQATKSPEKRALIKIAAANGIGLPANGRQGVTVYFTFGADGVSIKQVERGKPTVMSGDAAKARRYFRQVRKMDQRLPTKTRKQSKTSQVKEAVEDRILVEAMIPPTRRLSCEG